MRVAIKKVEGVDTVKVSLNEGYAEVSFKPGSRATLEQIRDIVRRNGFTPRGAEVRIAGQLVQHEGKLALAVSGSDAVYLLAEDRPSRGGSRTNRKARLKMMPLMPSTKNTSCHGRTSPTIGSVVAPCATAN